MSGAAGVGTEVNALQIESGFRRSGTPHFAGGWTNRIFGNRQISPLLILRSGPPFHPVTGVDNSCTGSHTNFSNPTTSLQSSNFGVILAASDPRILRFSTKYTL